MIRPISWVALGWGEPCVPWWGGARFAGRPWWGGWGGPRVVNKVVVHHTTVVNVTSIKGYRNADVRHAVVTVPGERFGRGPVAAARLAGADVTGLRPARGALAIRPTPASLVPTGHAVKPRARERRRVVAVRPPADVSPRLRAAGFDSTPAPAVAVPRAKVVPGRATPPEVVPERRSPRARGVDQLDHRRTPPLRPRSPGGSGASSGASARVAGPASGLAERDAADSRAGPAARGPYGLDAASGSTPGGVPGARSAAASARAAGLREDAGTARPAATRDRAPARARPGSGPAGSARREPSPSAGGPGTGRSPAPARGARRRAGRATRERPHRAPASRGPRRAPRPGSPETRERRPAGEGAAGGAARPQERARVEQYGELNQ